MNILITGGNGNIAKMIKNNLSNSFNIKNPGRSELNILDFQKLSEYLEENQFDILVHTAILGGRRTKDENGDVSHINLLMLENLLKFSNKFKMIINFDSAAIYDRSTDIYNRNESDLLTVPSDYYGFSKYVIYQRSLQYSQFYNFRIFNIYHHNEENDRFVKSCFNAKKNNTEVTIFEDKYFDFVYETDFVKIIKFYFDNLYEQNNLHKTINICYEENYKLSEIAKLILNEEHHKNINIIKPISNNNYCGNNSLLKSLNIDLMGLNESLKIYDKLYNKQ